MPFTPVLTIRTATSNDIPTIARIDIAANPTHPLTTKPWANLEDAFSVFLPRYQLFFSDPFMHFIVAEEVKEGEEFAKEIVGFAIWREGGGHPEPEYNPVLPESANGALIMYFVETVAAHKKSLGLEHLPELETFGVSPAHQRKGVGAAMLRILLEEIDKKGERMYVSSSQMGKGLYEKFGWRSFGKANMDFSQFGIEQPCVTWDMLREVNGVVS